MKISVVVLVAALLSAVHTFAREGAPADEVTGFSLLPPARCADAHDGGRCTVARPKDWTADERHVIHQTMLRLANSELVRGLLVGARENGYSGFRRYVTDTRPDPALGHVPMFNPGFVLYSARVIGLTDAYFQTDGVRDPISDYRFGDLILVHELVHAADNRKRSSEQGFTSITGWISRDDQWKYAHRVNYSAYLGVYADTLTLYATGRYDEAWSRDRWFATSLKFPVPTIQSLASPDESFADILAHLIVDPHAATYLQPTVVDWFERNVFPSLFENAQRFRPADYEVF